MKFAVGIFWVATLGAVMALPSEAITANESYKQADTGMVYPAKVGAFQRGEILHDEKEESAVYHLDRPGNEIVATVRVYKAPPLMLVGSAPPQGVLEALHRGICMQKAAEKMKASAPDSTGSEPTATSLKRGMFSTKDGYTMSYTMTLPQFAGRTQVAVRSDLYRFCSFDRINWAVEYRFDYPRDANVSKDIADFMRELDWTFG